MFIKCPICGEKAEVLHWDRIIGEMLVNWFEMEISCVSCQSAMMIRTYSEKKLKDWACENEIKQEQSYPKS